VYHLKNPLKLLLLSVFIALVLTSCADPRFEVKELIVRNNTTYPITGLSISSDVGELDMRAVNNTPTIIAPGAEKSFALVTPATTARLILETQNASAYVRFTYDHLVNGKNEAIIATFTEVELECIILLEGSNSEPIIR
jgi:hypothetical protein